MSVTKEKKEEEKEEEKEKEKEEKEQIVKLEAALSNNNIFELRELSLYGFVNNDLRKRIWPLLLGYDDCDDDVGNIDDVIDCNDYIDQIKKDTVRSMHHFDITKSYNSFKREQEQEALGRILNYIFGNNRDLHYTQGFHDMCSVFYIVCGEFLGKKLSENLAKRHMRDLVRDNMNVYQFILKLLFPLLSLIDNELYLLFISYSISSIFSLSWILTWFAHNIETFDDICRLYDFFLSSHPLMPLYLSVSLILSCKKELISINQNEGKLDQGRLHQFFQEYDWNINYDQIISNAHNIFNKYPPHDLYRQYFIDELKDIPKDSPFLAKNINEIENMKSKYSGSNLNSIWCYQNPKFWRYIAIPMLTAIVIFHVANSHINKA